MGGPRHVVPQWLNFARLADADPSGDWEQRAACRGEDLDLFFPTSGRTEQAAEAKRVCQRCPVLYRCLAAQLKHRWRDDHGIWGGTTVDERKAIRKALALRETG